MKVGTKKVDLKILETKKVLESLPFSRKYSVKEAQTKKDEVKEKKDIDVVDAYEFRIFPNRNFRTTIFLFSDMSAAFVVKHKKAMVGKLRKEIVIAGGDPFLASQPPVSSISLQELAEHGSTYQVYESHEEISEIVLWYFWFLYQVDLKGKDSDSLKPIPGRQVAPTISTEMKEAIEVHFAR